MPASYAHYRFGKQVLPELPGEVRQQIQRFRRMYDMGLNGPDILFFCNPLMKNAVSDLCGQYHAQSGADFFTHACAQAGSEAARAYLYGLLAHYCLDAACRPFLQQKALSSSTSTAALEAEFDRYLMAADGIADPHTQDLSRRLKLTRGECMTVASFYPPATGGNISACVWSMRQLYKLSANANRENRQKLLRKLKPSLCDHLIPEEAPASAALMDSELLARYNRAAKQYPELLRQLLGHMRTAEALGDDFIQPFG